MKNRFILILIFLLPIKIVTAQIPVNEYRNEISNLKTEKDFKTYWDKLFNIDQEILVKLEDKKKSDSLSIDNMVRTA